MNIKNNMFTQKGNIYKQDIDSHYKFKIKK